MTTPGDTPGEPEPQPPSTAFEPPAGYTPTPAPPPAYGQYGAPTQYGGTPAAYGGSPSPYSATPGAAYASWLVRVAASILDFVIIGVPAVIIIVIGLSIGHGIGQLLAVLAYIAAAVAGIWNIVFRQGNTGQTIGKQIVSIKLIRELDGQPVGPGMSFVRQLAHFLDSLACYVGWLWPLWDAKNQTFADKLCGTVVVSA